MQLRTFRTGIVLTAAILPMLVVVAPFRALSVESDPGDSALGHWVFRPTQFDGRTLRASAGPLDGTVIGPVTFSSEGPPALLLAGDAKGKQRVLLADQIAAARRALPTLAMSAEAWVRIEAVGEWGGIIGAVQDNGGFEKGWVLGTRGPQFVFGLSTEGADDGDGAMTYLASAVAFEPGAWYHVVATYDGAEQQIWVDATLQGSSRIQAGAINYPEDLSYTIGAYHDGDEFHPVTGAFAEVSVLARALDETEIRARFDAQRASFPGIVPVKPRIDGWPTYLRDPKRSGYTDEDLEIPLSLRWVHRVRQVPAPAWPPPARQNFWGKKFGLRARVIFDRAFHVVADRYGIYFGSSADDRVVCLDRATGRERWSFFTDGPVRLAPTLHDGRVVFGSDDGFVYCLDAREGRLAWRARIGPDDWRLPGNGRVISLWPVRTGVLVSDGVAIACAGLFPRQGSFRAALDLRDGRFLARERTDVSAQGYLVRRGPRLFVQEGRAPEKFIADLKRHGKTHSPAVTSIPADYPYALIGAGELRVAGGDGRVAAFDARSGDLVWTAPVEGVAYSLAIAHGELLVSTDRGVIHCFGPRGRGEASEDRSALESPVVTSGDAPDSPSSRRAGELAGRILAETGVHRGYCLVLGGDDMSLTRELVRRSELKVIVVAFQTDDVSIEALRRALAAEGLYGSRVVVHEIDQTDRGRLPYTDYLANLVISDRGFPEGPTVVDPGEVDRLLVPGRGVAWIGGMTNFESPARGAFLEAALEWTARANPMMRWERRDDQTGVWAMYRRPPLTGSGQWTHMYADAANTVCSGDRRVEGDLALQWFGQPGPRRLIDRHHRTVPPLVKDGRLFVPGDNRFYGVDAYNGTILWEIEIPDSRRVGAFRDCGNAVATDTHLFVAAGNRCVAIDPETGRRKRVFEALPVEGEVAVEWGYLGAAGDLLFGSSVRPGASRRTLSRETIDETYYDERPIVCSLQLFAIDSRSGNTRWAYRPAHGLIPNPTIAIAGETVYFVESTNPETLGASHGRETLARLVGSGSRVVALDRTSGRVRWRASPDLSAIEHNLYLSHSGETVVIVGSRNQDRRVVYDILALEASTGQPRWSRSQDNRTEPGGDHGEQDHRPVIVDDLLVVEPFAYRLHDGRPVESWAWKPEHRRGCGTVSASASTLFFRQQNAASFDLRTGSFSPVTAVSRPGCWINMIPAAGLLLIPEASSGCTCDFPVQASMAFRPVAPGTRESP